MRISAAKGGMVARNDRKRRSAYVRTAEEATNKLTAMKVAIKDGLPLGDVRLTLGDYLRRWVEARSSQLRPKTLVSYRGLIEDHLAHRCADDCPADCAAGKLSLDRTNLLKLSPSAVERFCADKIAAGYSARTSGYLRGLLRQALNDAQRDGLVPRNVAAIARAPKGSSIKPRVEPLTAEQTKKLLAETKGDRLEAAFIVLSHLGLRVGELQALKWDAIDLEAGRVAIVAQLQRHDGKWLRTEPKSDRSKRVLDLSAPVVETLRAHRVRQSAERLAAGPAWQGDGLVFTGLSGRALHGKNIHAALQVLLGRAGLPSRRTHDLRHGAATLLVRGRRRHQNGG